MERNAAEKLDLASARERIRSLIDRYRDRCLWFLREDCYPATAAEALRMLEAIERHGDLEAFREAATLRRWLSQWLSQHSSATFAV
jgi:hypothetical protein